MAISVDTSVLLDILLEDEKFGEASEKALIDAHQAEGLIICETALAEIVPVLSGNPVAEFLHDWNIDFEPSSLESASLAGEMFNTYL
jgi:predicted nucleic acid-binding protein